MPVTKLNDVLPPVLPGHTKPDRAPVGVARQYYGIIAAGLWLHIFRRCPRKRVLDV